MSITPIITTLWTVNYKIKKLNLIHNSKCVLIPNPSTPIQRHSFIECRNDDGISSAQSKYEMCIWNWNNSIHFQAFFSRKVQLQTDKQITREYRIDINAVTLKINKTAKINICIDEWLRDVCGCFMQLQLNSIINNLPFMTLNFSRLF